LRANHEKVPIQRDRAIPSANSANRQVGATECSPTPSAHPKKAAASS
jgi:hypothetical protein